MTADRDHVGTTGTTDVEFWRQVLEEAPALLELPHGPADHTVADVPIDRPFAADDVVVAVAGLLARYSSTGVVVLTVGQRGAWLPVTVDLADNPAAETAAQRCAAAREAASEHPVALDVLVAEVGPSITQVAVSLDATPWPWDEAPALGVFVGAGEVRVHSIVGAAGVVADHLGALLWNWTGDTPLTAVSMLTAEERESLLAASAGDSLDLPPGTVWHEIAAHVRATPDAVALTDGARRLTYAELDTQVAALAAELTSRGLGPGTLVGLCVSRSALMVVGLLAVMRSGAAYVPIDPTYPPDRVGMMIEDAELTTVVTESALLERIPEAIEHRVLVDATRPPREPVGGGARADGLAYVIFTSGSTGRPKGVMVGHRALLNFVLSIAREPGLAAGDRLLAVTTLSFDIAGLELLVPLVVGATVVVADRDTVLDPALLANRLETDRITVMQATPATWRMLVDWGWSGSPDLRILCGGEALPAVLADELRARCAQLWNMYGPTETTIWSLATRMRAGDPVTIGTPIANTTAFVVGRHQELLPDGVAGELLIGGTGLAEGYLGRPDLTSERFIADTLTGAPDARLYRTGDLVRRRSDGRIEFISRMDNQVKVRGFRIELGEIETVLDERDDVARSVAVVLPDPVTGTNQLVAYVVAAGGAALEPSQLRDHVAACLPPYMVPSSVVVLDAFPLTLNGKIDRKALPAPETVADDDRSVVAPRSDVERRLVTLWQEVLRFSPIGITDDVFELGAGSLTIARLYTRMAQELGVDLPVAAAFGAPTIEAVAALVERSTSGRVDTGSYVSLVPIRATGSRRPLFLVHGGAGTVLLFEPLARGLGSEQPVFAFQAAGLYGSVPPQRSVADMAALYVREMQTVQAHGPYRLGGYCYGALVAFEMARQLVDAGEQAELLVAFNGSSPSYIRRFRPLFDADGARTDAQGELTDRPMAARDRVGHMWRHRTSAGDFAREFGRRAYSVARGKAGHVKYQATLHGAVVLKRPLPESMRESGAFQWLSVYAQERYDPPRLDGGMVVVRAAGLYHRDDLGWGEHVTGTVDVVEVPGEQLTPRDSMKSAYVEPIVAAIEARLRALDEGQSTRTVSVAE